jgi:hypothetical protein
MDEQKHTDPSSEEEKELDDLELPDEEADAVKGGAGSGGDQPTESISLN